MKVITISHPADDPEVVLMNAAASELETVAVVGIDRNGELYVASSERNHRLAHYLFHQGAAYLLELPGLYDE